MKIICISGKAQHGKDTAANCLKECLERYNKRVLVAHNADLLKYICRTYFNWSGLKDAQGRSLLQYVGTDVIRDRDPDFWVRFLAQFLGFFEDIWDYVVIPDCRFSNEIDYLRTDFDVTHIRIVRTNFESPLTKEQQDHPSETALDDCQPDLIIENAGDLSDLHDLLADYIDEIEQKA